MIVLENASLGQETFLQKFVVQDANTGKPITYGANIRVYDIANGELIGKGDSDEKGELTIPIKAKEDTVVMIVGQAGEYGEFIFRGMTGKNPIVIRFRKPEAGKSEEYEFPVLPVAGVAAIALGIVLYHLLG